MDSSKRPVMTMKPWTSTYCFSNEIDSSMSSGWFSPFIGWGVKIWCTLFINPQYVTLDVQIVGKMCYILLPIWQMILWSFGSKYCHVKVVLVTKTWLWETPLAIPNEDISFKYSCFKQINILYCRTSHVPSIDAKIIAQLLCIWE